MRTPSRFERPPASIRRSERIIRRAKSIPAIAGFIPAFEAAVNALSDSYQSYLSARTNKLVAIGDQNEARAALDEQIRGVGLAALAVGRGRRRSELYQKYFPNPHGSYLSRSATSARETASAILGLMTDETRQEIVARREPLTRTVTLLEAAMTNLEAAVAALGDAKGRMEEQKLAWRKAYTWFYFEIRNILSDNRKAVEDLFRLPHGSAGDDEDSGEDKTGTTEDLANAITNSANDEIRGRSQDGSQGKSQDESQDESHFKAA
jgi:hypothetical protein